MMLFVIWAVMILGEWIVAALALRKIRKTYPWFTTLVCFMALKSVILFYIRAIHPPLYFYTYYRLEFTVSFLQIGATVEVFGTMFRPFWTVPAKSLTTLTLSTSIALAVVARANVTLLGGSGEIAFYHSIDRVVSFSMGILLAAAMLFAQHFEMPMRSRVKGISAGLYVMCVTSIVMTLVMTNLNGVVTNSVAFVPVIAHYATLTIWTFYLARAEALMVVLDRNELEEVRNLLDQFILALRNTPTSCGLTARKRARRVEGEIKAKMVNQK